MNSGLCDVHCHILPGIDDGARDMEETMQALRTAARQGIRAVIATPHYYPEKYETDPETIHALCQEVRDRCKAEGLQLRIYAGQECFYHSELAEKLDRGEALTLAGSRYVLTEFSPNCLYLQLQQGLMQLQQSGYRPVLAHFERYECLENPDRLQELKSRGILLQMNLDTILQKKGLFQKTQWQRLLQSGMVDLLGSDCHGTHFRPYHADKSMKWLVKQVDQEIRREMLITNVKNILRKR